jgi:Domain of unknown function (DUF4129)
VNLQAPAADSVRAALRDVFADPRYRWAEQRGGLLALVKGWLRALQQWMMRLEVGHPAIYYVLLVVSAVLLLAILVHFAYLTWQALHPHAAERGGVVGRAMPVRDAAWHRAEFRRLLAEGRFAEALAERFATLISELQQRAVVRLDPSKTPAEYAAEARLDDAGRGMMAGLVDELYHRLFGGAACTADDVARFDDRAAEVARYRAAS